MVLAAAPSWFAENIVAIAGATLLVLSVLILRLVQKTALRVVLLAIALAMALFVYANRFALEECASTCSCRVARHDVTLPACDVDLT